MGGDDLRGDGPVPADLTGQFLIAETDLQDPNFFRTVVVIIQHGEDGAFGLVVNRPSDVEAGDVIEEVHETPLEQARIFVGGPVQQNFVFSLHTGLPSVFQSQHIEQPSPGIWFEPSFQHVIEYSRSGLYQAPGVKGAPQTKVFAGYSGWGPGQLEEELAEGAWYMHPASTDVVFGTEPSRGWREALSKKGGYYKIVAETGFRPSLN